MKLQLTEQQIEAINTAMDAPYKCTLCSKKSVRPAKHPHTRYASLQPFGKEAPVFSGFDPGDLQLAMFCATCGDKISDLAGKIRSKQPTPNREEVLKEVQYKLAEIGPPSSTLTLPTDPLKAFRIWLSRAICGREES